MSAVQSNSELSWIRFFPEAFNTSKNLLNGKYRVTILSGDCSLKVDDNVEFIDFEKLRICGGAPLTGYVKINGNFRNNMHYVFCTSTHPNSVAIRLDGGDLFSVICEQAVHMHTSQQNARSLG